MTRDCVLALIVLAVTVSGTYFVTTYVAREQEAGATAASLSYRQRILSLEIALQAEELALTPLWDDWHGVRENLRASLKEFERIHKALTIGDPELGIHNLPSPQVRAIHFKAPYRLHNVVKQYCEIARRVLGAEGPDQISRRDVSTLDITSRRQLQNGLAVVSVVYSQEAKQRVAQLRMVQTGLYGASLLALMLVGGAVFRPMVRRVDSSTNELIDAKSLLEHSARHDPLTHLPNRRYLAEHLDRTLSEAERAGREVALMHIDLDRFKEVNDTLGHAAGDQVLANAAGIMQAELRSGDFLARIGGDEFVLVSAGGADPADLAALADRLIAEIEQTGCDDAQPAGISASIGIALAKPGSGWDADDLMLNSDIALYDAKSDGRACHRFFQDPVEKDEADGEDVAEDMPNDSAGEDGEDGARLSA
ncbi:MAG: diguanylate cyclase [Pseudomonadota bacterium]